MAHRNFKISFSREATKYIIGLLTPLRKDEQGQWLEKLVDVIQKQGLDTTTVEKSHVEKAAKVCVQPIILFTIS